MIPPLQFMPWLLGWQRIVCVHFFEVPVRPFLGIGISGGKILQMTPYVEVGPAVL